MPDRDPLHPYDRCTCTGEGKCDYCQRTEPAKVEAELRERTVELLAEVKKSNRLKGRPGTPPLTDIDLTLELVLSALVNMEARITSMEQGLEDLRHEVLG